MMGRKTIPGEGGRIGSWSPVSYFGYSFIYWGCSTEKIANHCDGCTAICMNAYPKNVLYVG